MSALTLSASGPLARSIVRFVDNRAALFGLAVLVPMLLAILTYPLWLPYKPNDIDLMAMNAGPSATHWFGTDGVGRDVFARTLEGGRISLLVAVSSVVLSTAIGFLVGAISAFMNNTAAVAIFLPLVLLYTAWVYKVLWGRTSTAALKTDPALY